MVGAIDRPTTSLTVANLSKDHVAPAGNSSFEIPECHQIFCPMSFGDRPSVNLKTISGKAKRNKSKGLKTSQGHNRSCQSAGQNNKMPLMTRSKPGYPRRASTSWGSVDLGTGHFASHVAAPMILPRAIPQADFTRVKCCRLCLLGLG